MIKFQSSKLPQFKNSICIYLIDTKRLSFNPQTYRNSAMFVKLLFAFISEKRKSTKFINILSLVLNNRMLNFVYN